jgi:hypothetical protein
MRDKTRELEELGMVYKIIGAEWACPPLILPKPGPGQYRMTVYMRVPNASTKPTKWLRKFCDAGFLSRLLADTSARRLARLSIVHHAGWIMHAEKWSEVVNLLQSVLNNSLSMRLNKGTPMQFFTGNAETSPLVPMLNDNVSVNARLDFIKAQKHMEV